MRMWLETQDEYHCPCVVSRAKLMQLHRHEEQERHLRPAEAGAVASHAVVAACSEQCLCQRRRAVILRPPNVNHVVLLLRRLLSVDSRPRRPQALQSLGKRRVRILCTCLLGLHFAPAPPPQHHSDHRH